ncbi:hypothetical protein [Faecalibacillus intestinalis]|jgi:hypothetical protein|uniref:hypothetical protein n=1 Tax=Faecalibacillus intestinalis TaxID=1982626 RepID=UPI0022E50B0C|nr:hypothetical protein [Faecalibacillus intestinalis]
MQLKRTMTDQEIKKIGKEEKTLLFVEFLKRYSRKDKPFENLNSFEHELSFKLDFSIHNAHIFGTKTTRGNMVKKIAWYYNVNRYGYLMKPENWVIVYDDLLKYYDANKENEEKLYFPTPKNFGRDQRIFNLYYNHEALTPVIRYGRDEF